VSALERVAQQMPEQFVAESATTDDGNLIIFN
jgi:hypothetical protein